MFEYTDANYDALGLLVQTVSGQSFESYIAENVFEPLDMRHSYTDQTDARTDGLATGHRSWFGYPRPFQAPYSRAAMPSSYLISSAEDVAHFLTMQLNGGRYAATSVVSPEGVAAMHKPAIKQGDRDIFYGMGWESRELSGVPVVRHDGTNANFYADMLLDPRDRWGVVILTNFDSLNLNGGRLQGLSRGCSACCMANSRRSSRCPTIRCSAAAMLLVAIVTIAMMIGILRTDRAAAPLAQPPRQPAPRRPSHGPPGGAAAGHQPGLGAVPAARPFPRSPTRCAPPCSSCPTSATWLPPVLRSPSPGDSCAPFWSTPRSADPSAEPATSQRVGQTQIRPRLWARPTAS